MHRHMSFNYEPIYIFSLNYVDRITCALSLFTVLAAYVSQMKGLRKSLQFSVTGFFRLKKVGWSFERDHVHLSLL